MSPPRRRRFRLPLSGNRVLWAIVAVAGSVSGCTGEDAVPIDPADPPSTVIEPDLTDVTHTLEPTPQMEQLARQQCLDDPARGEGYIEAVDPESGRVMTSITVDCDDVRDE